MNSSLTAYTKLSPHHSGQRKYKIERITPHCVVGQATVERLGNIFNGTRKVSANYGIGRDGRIGLYVDESNRSWCSSSVDNDNRAVTIECASDSTHPYAFKEVVYESLINLCVDICKRYGKNKLIWIPNKNKALSYVPAENEMILTVHRWFAAKACPGDWLYNRLGDLANKVTAKLGGDIPLKIPIEKKIADTQEQFKLKVFVKDLKINKTASNDTATKRTTGIGIFTITEIKNGFGKLKSGIGWIDISNPKQTKIIQSGLRKNYKIYVGNFYNKSDAELALQKIKNIGFNAIIIE